MWKCYHLQYVAINIQLIICNISIILFVHISFIVFQVKLLKSLGLQSTLITDGSSPINLFNTAHGLVGGAMGGASKRQKQKICSSIISSVDEDNY